MKIKLRKIATYLFFGFLLLIYSFVNEAFAQDIIIKINALQDLKAVSLDSILILNETNKSSLKLGDLSQNSTEYQVNLKNTSLQFLSRKSETPENDKIAIHGILSGFIINEIGRAHV